MQGKFIRCYEYQQTKTILIITKTIVQVLKQL